MNSTKGTWIKGISVGLGLLMILIPASCTSTATVSEGASSTENWPIGNHWRYSPQSIWGDTLIAGEYVYGDGPEEKYISIYNLQTREKQRLREIPADYLFEEPAIYEDKIVWASCYYSQELRMSRQKDFDTLNWDIFLLDISTGELRQITTDEHAQKSARIYGDNIVWLDSRHEEAEEYPHYFDVYVYDLTTGKEKRITTTTSVEGHSLDISDSLVVWTDNRNDSPSSRIDTYPPVVNEDIYLYDLSTNQERRITTDPASDSSPVINNGRIVWKRTWKVRSLDIFLYDVETGQETQISKSGYAAQGVYPGIYGDRVVWADARLTRGNSCDDEFGLDEAARTAESGSAEIYLYDLTTEQEVLLVPSEGIEFSEKLKGREIKSTAWQVWLDPVIHGDFVVYTLSRMVDPAVYAMKLR